MTLNVCLKKKKENILTFNRNVWDECHKILS